VSINPPEHGAPLESCLVRVQGRVQGVGFREACVHEAHVIGVTGWVRNRADGSVEALLQGSPERVARMRLWLRHGPPMAQVKDYAVSEVPAPFQRYDRFERRYTE
jgi:acylphosphatase